MMAKRKKKTRKSMVAWKRQLLNLLARAKSSATGRTWDELHYCESRLTRVFQGRKSSFTPTKKK